MPNCFAESDCYRFNVQRSRWGGRKFRTLRPGCLFYISIQTQLLMLHESFRHFSWVSCLLIWQSEVPAGRIKSCCRFLGSRNRAGRWWFRWNIQKAGNHGLKWQLLHMPPAGCRGRSGREWRINHDIFCQMSNNIWQLKWQIHELNHMLACLILRGPSEVGENSALFPVAAGAALSVCQDSGEIFSSQIISAYWNGKYMSCIRLLWI